MVTKTVSLEQEINPWEAQAARFDLAAHKLNLDEGLWKVLRYPNREIIVHIPSPWTTVNWKSLPVFGCSTRSRGAPPRAAFVTPPTSPSMKSVLWQVG